MTDVSRRRLALALCLAVAAACFGAGIHWGLPSRAADPYLFGDRPVWGGQTILRLGGGGWSDEDSARGADVDANPLTGRDQPIVLNDTDARRAEIALRYRLYTYQPDELVTMRALGKMKPGEGDFDPRAYQYGGLWMYPVGAMLKAASICRLIELHGGEEGRIYYLDHPDAFGRFYIVARLYSALWGIVGAWAVFEIVRRLLDGQIGPAVAAALGYAAMPVVVNMAHEAKPHLAGAVLTLLAVLAADRFVRTGARRHWLLAGAVCGAAFGMVLTALVSFAVLPVMTLFRPIPWGRRFGITAGAVAVGLAVYCVTNPYVPINLIRGGKSALTSNTQNTKDFYRAADLGRGFVNTAKLVARGASPVVAVAGVAGAIGLAAMADARRRRQEIRSPHASAAGWLLLGPAVLTLLQMAAFGAGKPAEYGRFGILPDVALLIAAVVALTLLTWAASPVRLLQPAALALLALCTAVVGGQYLWNFVLDSRPVTPRLLEASRLQQLAQQGGQPLTVALLAEPAPYAVPPVNLFDGKLVLLPKGSDPSVALPEVNADAFVATTDDPSSGPPPSGYVALPPAAPGPQFVTPISWAAKPMWVWVRDSMTDERPLPPTRTADPRADE